MIRNPLEALFVATRGVRLPHGFTSVSDLLGGGPTASGVAVSESSAESLPVVFACVRVISQAVASLPLKLHRRTGAGAEIAADHPLHRVLHDAPNPETTAYDFRAMLMSHLLLWGEAFAEIERHARGEAVALWPLQPLRMRVDRDEQRRLRYTYHPASGETRVWVHDPYRPPILRLIVNSADGVTGRSVVRILRESLGLSVAHERFASRFFGNGATFGGLLATDDPLDDPDDQREIREQIERVHGGVEKAHKLLVLGGGFKFTPFSMPLEDAQFLESRKFERSVLCGAFGVPPHMIGDLERATFSNVEHESLRWLRDGLEPHLTNIEQVIVRDCLGPRQAADYFPRFQRQAMLRGDLKTRTEALAIQRRLGVLSADEWRAIEDANPIGPAHGGDAYVIIGGGTATPSGEAGKADGGSE